MRPIITILLVFVVTISFCQTKHELDSLTNMLEKISVNDQKYRLGLDSINMNMVGNVLDKFGWLSKQQTLEDANAS